MRNLSKVWVGVLSAVVSAKVATAVPYVAPNGELIEVEYWAGSGSNEALVVVDFNQGPSDVYTFGYRWDGAANGGQALTAIVAEGGLDAAMTNWGGPPPAENLFIDSFTYDGVTLVNEVNFPWSPSWLFYYDDIVGPGELVGWTMAELWGMSGHLLANGAFEGWLFSYDQWPEYTDEPRQPLAAQTGEGGIPEPGTVALLVAGLAGLASRHRRRRGA
jgi:hypothetical protein